jgi:hypothetical protein
MPQVEQTPQGPFAVFLAPIDGFYDHITYEACSVQLVILDYIIASPKPFLLQLRGL